MPTNSPPVCSTTAFPTSDFSAIAITLLQLIPSDPIILLSFINTRLRDQYSSLDNLCDDLDIDRTELEEKLRLAGFDYNPDQNQFR